MQASKAKQDSAARTSRLEGFLASGVVAFIEKEECGPELTSPEIIAALNALAMRWSVSLARDMAVESAERKEKDET